MKGAYLCSPCDKCFAQMKILFKYLIKHIGDKLYYFKQFAKCFYTEAKSSREYMSHSGENPFLCSKCEKDFTGNYGIHNVVKIFMHTVW